MKTLHRYVGGRLGAAVLDAYVSVVDLSDFRFLVHATAWPHRETVPNVRATPVIGLERIFTMPAVIDVDIHCWGPAFCRDRIAGGAEQPLFFKRPPNYLVIRAAR